MAAYKSLREFIDKLEAAGELVRVKTPVSTHLEMTEIQTRLLAEKGPAVLFENVTLEDGTWGLVRASSNKPSLVVVVESPASEANMRAIFNDIDTRLSQHPEVGEYDQKI